MQLYPWCYELFLDEDPPVIKGPLVGIILLLVATWLSKGVKANIVARSSVEVEYKVLAHGFYKLMWIQIFLQELGFSLEKLICMVIIELLFTLPITSCFMREPNILRSTTILSEKLWWERKRQLRTSNLKISLKTFLIKFWRKSFSIVCSKLT